MDGKNFGIKSGPKKQHTTEFLDGTVMGGKNFSIYRQVKISMA
jgi:hypothetical protein